MRVEPFEDKSAEPAVRGFLHTPDKPIDGALVLTHGAGANCQSKLLVAVSNTFSEAGFPVLRCDLPFRQTRPHGPPFPAMAIRDREGLARAIAVMKQKAGCHVFLGGHSYGGRQATMLAAEQPGLVAGLLLLSYPLHPPRKPEQMRTAHFPGLNTPALFVHGARDPFGSYEEMRAALAMIPSRTMLYEVERVGHELLPKNRPSDLTVQVVSAFQTFFS